MNQFLDDNKPVVAVLTVGDEWKQFRGNRSNFRDIMKTGRELNYPVYVVTTKDLKLSSPRIQGYIFDPVNKVWHRQWCPLPDVIYNRIPLREDEQKRTALRKIDECLNHHSIHIYNPFFFNKWRLFDWLKRSHSTKQFVADTKKMLNARSLSTMLQTYKGLYLKPESGNAGKGIMLLELDESSPLPYRLTIQGRIKKNLVYKTAKLPALWKKIKKETGKSAYIMQERITLSSYRNRNFDLRVLVQKTGKGSWMVTGVGARLAGLKRITTHVPQGGSVEDPEKLLLPTFGQEMTTNLLNRLKANALLIAKQVEKGAGYNLGEMSMDLGIDTGGRIWFFEANAKPMKFDEPHIRKKSLERIFQYSHFLSQQPKG